MSLCPQADAMENGLMLIINELMGQLWVDCGENIPALSVWEQTKQIEVLPVNRAEVVWQIDMVVNDKKLRFIWSNLKAIRDFHGLTEWDFGNCTADELAIAGGLMLTYFGKATVDGE